MDDSVSSSLTELHSLPPLLEVIAGLSSDKGEETFFGWSRAITRPFFRRSNPVHPLECDEDTIRVAHR
ncbi:hypothetical protein LptCag_1566 [Leptospirillum ferriphilum]|uniref:Uncharacterized protein n=1 Tax=Leptospirillum ferriphilum TaxID=178606 RepID=A0A094YKU6_9BACT|nr:hypothetical protein LptCag_1566 [Leptospirillum ferriphilum]